jgi:hypothetical protein
VTTGSGSRNGGASGSHDEGGGPGDRDDDDPRLRAMRAVWLTMRHEDPPGSGLAELLAAARAKAETMQAGPTWWQRLVAALRRPQALALATVLVLVGGAVLLGRHPDRMELRDRVSGSAGPMSGSERQATPPTVERPRDTAPAGAPEPGAATQGSMASTMHGGAARAPDPAGGEVGTEGATTSGVAREGAATTGGVAREGAATTGGVAREGAATEGWTGASSTREGGAGVAGSDTHDSLRAGAAAPGRGSEKADSTRWDAAPGQASGKAGSSTGSVASGRGSMAANKELAPALPPATPRQQATDSGAASTDAPKLQRRDEPAGPRRGGDAPDPDAKRTPRGVPPSESALPHARATGDDAEALATSHDESPSSSARDAKKRDGRTDATTTVNTAPAHATRPGSQGGSLAKLYKQCESAARRGDCVAVKRIAGQITTTDRGYRARLDKDSPIAKCLAD